MTVIPFKRKPPPPEFDIMTPMVNWCMNVTLMQMAAFSMFCAYWDQR